MVKLKDFELNIIFLIIYKMMNNEEIDYYKLYRIYPRPVGECDDCDGEIFLKCGEKNIAHWAHKSIKHDKHEATNDRVLIRLSKEYLIKHYNENKKVIFNSSYLVCSKKLVFETVKNNYNMVADYSDIQVIIWNVVALENDKVKFAIEISNKYKSNSPIRNDIPWFEVNVFELWSKLDRRITPDVIEFDAKNNLYCGKCLSEKILCDGNGSCFIFEKNNKYIPNGNMRHENMYTCQLIKCNKCYKNYPKFNMQDNNCIDCNNTIFMCRGNGMCLEKYDSGDVYRKNYIHFGEKCKSIKCLLCRVNFPFYKIFDKRCYDCKDKIICNEKGECLLKCDNRLVVNNNYFHMNKECEISKCTSKYCKKDTFKKYFDSHEKLCESCFDLKQSRPNNKCRICQNSLYFKYTICSNCAKKCICGKPIDDNMIVVIIVKFNTLIN
jgi:hypothetical protein